jgi:hypothetical protein
MSDPKLDPIWLDTCVVIKVYNGDKIAEYFLKHLHDEGYELLLVPAANNELLDGNPLTMDVERPVWEQGPTESTRAALEALKLRLGITVDMSAGAIPMKTRSMYAMQGHRKADAIDRKILKPANQNAWGMQRRWVISPSPTTSSSARSWLALKPEKSLTPSWSLRRRARREC